MRSREHPCGATALIREHGVRTAQFGTSRGTEAGTRAGLSEQELRASDGPDAVPGYTRYTFEEKVTRSKGRTGCRLSRLFDHKLPIEKFLPARVTDKIITPPIPLVVLSLLPSQKCRKRWERRLCWRPASEQPSKLGHNVDTSTRACAACCCL